MTVFEKPGSFVPSTLHRHLVAQGVDCEGVTATEDSRGKVTAVQIICLDGTTEAAIDAAIATYPEAAAANDAQRTAEQRAEAEHVRVANTNETDWIITPPPDTEQNILNQIANNLPAWQTFRQTLRALPIQTIPDPTQLVWPVHPVRPYTALTPQPAFVQGGGTP